MSCLTTGTSIIIHSRKKGGTKRAIIANNGTCPLHLVPDNVVCPNAVYVINANIIISPGDFLRRVRGLRTRKVGTGRLRVSAHTRIMFPCRVHLSRTRRVEGNDQGLKAAGGKVKPYCTSGVGHVNVHVYSLVSGRIFTRGLGCGIRRGGVLLRGLCKVRNFSCRRVLVSCLRCTRELHPCIGSAGCAIRALIERKGGILFRNTRTSVLSYSGNACPFIASSRPATNNTYVNTNVKPRVVRGVFNIIGTCDAHIKRKPFPARRIGRVNSHVQSVTRRFNAIANHPHHMN